MSSPTWTPDALRSELRSYTKTAWRLVEAQNIASTMQLVDTLDEQALLEDILEDSKPPVPEDCRGLDYLLSTPFRYRPYPHGSRFRRAGMTPGVWYGAEAVGTSVAEMVFYRYLFFAESPETPFPREPSSFSAFAAPIASETALDLTKPPLAKDQAIWTDPTNYDACQMLAEVGRDAGADVIRYTSVRDPDGGAAIAVLSCAAFAAAAPVSVQTWWIRLTARGAFALCQFPRQRLSFDRESFAGDARLNGMIWERGPAP